MPPLATENDTYQEFFSINSWQQLCKTEWQREIIHVLADCIPDFVKDEIQGMRSRGEVRRISQTEDSSGIPLLANTLKGIIQKFQSSCQDKQEFTISFPKFRDIREKDIKELREIADKINLDRFNVNISKSVGAGAGIVGGLLLVGGTVATFLTAGAAVPLVAAGVALSASGGATTFGASAEETRRLVSDVNRAKAIIENDKANFKTFSQWLARSLELQDSLQQVMDFNLLKRTIEDFASVLQMTFRGNGRLEPFRGRVQAFVNAYLRDVAEMQSMAYWINVLSLLVAFMFALVSIQSRNRFMFDAAISGLKLGLGVARMVDVGVDAATAGLSLLRGGGGAVATSVGRVAAHSTLAAVGLALDTATLVMTSIDIHRGSKSENAAHIRAAADQLEEEQALMKIIYDELRQ